MTCPFLSYAYNDGVETYYACDLPKDHDGGHDYVVTSFEAWSAGS